MTTPVTASDPGAAAELEWLRKGRGRGGAALPVHETLGLQVREAEAGRCVARMPASPAVLGADRRILAGALAIVADACCGSAASTGLPPTTAVLSAQLRLEFAGPTPPAPGWVEGRATLTAVRDAAALARAELVDPAGELLAICSLRSLGTTWRAPATAAPPTTVPTQGPNQAQPSDPHRLLGVTSAAAGRGSAQLELRPTRAVANSFGAVHGGVLAMLAHITVADAVATLLGPDDEALPLDILVNYVRGVPAGGGPVSSAAQVTHHGRRFVVAEGEITVGDGRLAVRFSASTQIRPAGRP
ncbi:PaaI family thioesterase [Pseudofrankia sp. BMG5.37]|uniref:PaaI family thioesterase n=1 Tax=Pseudofrankia sp. BMG5.37 TaxID=3050035 RepID=UPI002895CB3C|nr:PaaI family thioesterase [Pseudofrankia sp. BMG5.37]MDT3441869.1 PaaI family thioesterase [Pseudofrankia sp. BMG5.37]